MIRRCYFFLLACCFSLVFCHAVGHAQLKQLAQAEQLLLRGNYQESQAAFAEVLGELPVQATLGLSRCHWEQGQLDEAFACLERQLTQSPTSAPLHSQIAWLALQCGNWPDCEVHLQQLASAENGIVPAGHLQAGHVQAAYVQADLLRVTGKIDQACEAYRKLAEQYDRQGKQLSSPRQLYWYAQALAQHARLNQDKERFRQLTTQLYPKILSLEPSFWQAHCQSGLLLLEKFNAVDAEAAFQDALQINPQAADIHVGLARLALNEFQLDRVRRHLDRALATNAKHLDALVCRADMEFASLRPQTALQTLQAAQKISFVSPKLLGRLAAAHQLLATPTDSRHRTALAELNKHAETAIGNNGEFHLARASALENARRYPQAGVSYQNAIQATPQLLGPRGRLGMIEMRLGHEDIARDLLKESFARDPYNVRVKNQLEVLDLLDSYATLQTEHFVIRYDEAHDRPLARQMARYAEECYEQLTQTFDYQLPERALLQVFHDGRGVKARQWFGARMVGLPNIHTIAACGGNIVAMVSPTAESRKLNWADILRHEIVHLINIQQTDYAVPHWLTEGCAVWQENRPRRAQWEILLAQRVPRGDVFNLDTINFGFLKPRSADDWQLAYCQAEIYVDLIAQEYGIEGVRRLLSSHRDNLPTDQAIERSLNTTQVDFEAAAAKLLAENAAELAVRGDLNEPPKLAELTSRWEQNPADLAAGANLALARLRQGDYPGAGRLARQVLEQQPTQPVARLVQAKLLIKIGDEKAAATELQGLSEVEPPQTEALKLLAGIHLRQGKLDEAKRLYERGGETQPNNLQWTKALAVVAVRQQDTAELNRLLGRIAHAEPDNLIARKKLLQLSQAVEDRPQIERWANEVLHVDPRDRFATEALHQLTPPTP